jgi:antitoxin VapB
MNIKSSEAADLAKRVSTITGETLTGAIVAALRERLERLERQTAVPSLVEQLREIATRAAALPTLDQRSAEEIIGYDENGIPR